MRPAALAVGLGALCVVGILHQKQTAPPLTTILLAVAMAALSSTMLAMDATPIITLQQAGGSAEVGALWLCALRTVCALFHVAVIVHTALMEPLALTVVYKRDLGSHLKSETFKVRGLRRLCTFFTIWTFAAQALFLVLAAACSAALAFERGELVPPRLLYITHLLFEMTAGCGFLITVVVTFVIW